MLLVNHISAGQQISSSGLNPQKSFSQYSMDHWDDEDGLPSNLIKDILKTSDGYIWIATFDGLVRFDGVKFDIIDNDQSKQRKYLSILSLLEDKDENLVIGTNGSGLLKYSQGKFMNIHSPDNFKNAFINSLVETKEGVIWVGTRNGLAKLENDTLVSVTDLPSLNNLAISSLYIDSKDNLWICTYTAGLIKKSGNYIKQYTTKEGLISNTINTIFEDSQKRLWIGTQSGLMQIDQHNYIDISKEFDLPKGAVNTIYEDAKGNIFIGTDHGLLRYYNHKFTLYSEKNGLTHNTITTIMDDSEGSIWLGTYHGGLVRLKDSRFLNYGTEEGVCYNVINTIYEDGDTYWIGTEDGISKFKNGKFSNYKIKNTPSTNRVKDILKDSKGNLLICTYNGLFEFHNGLKLKYSTKNGLSSNIVRTIVEGDDGKIWLGTSEGVDILENRKITHLGVQDGLLNSFILSMMKDENGNIWLGTNGGGLSIYQDGKLRSYTKKDGLSGNVIFNIYNDSSGLKWISTDDGICTYDGKNFISYPGVNNIIKRAVFQVLEDKKQNIWLTTSKGIYVIKKYNILNPESDKSDLANMVKLYDKTYGLRSNSITGGAKALIDREGKFWFPTLKGISIIDPNNIPVNINPPKVAIDKVLVGDKKYTSNESIRLKPGRNHVEFHYTGLDFFATKKVRFEYMLENLDKDWIKAGNRRIAYYNNMPPGKYTFKVKAANDDGIWNEKFATVEIIKDSFFYQTGWFYGLIGLLIMALAVFGYSLKIRNFSVMNKELARQVRERTKDINRQKEELQKINSSKDKLLSIISHDLKGPLNSIKQMLHLLSTGNLSHKELKYLSDNINKDVGLSLNLLDNLLNWARSQMQGIKIVEVKVNLHDIVNENFLLFNYNLNKKKIEHKNEVPEDEFAYADSDMVKLVIRNLIANAIKFTPEQGSIIVSSKSDDDFIEVAVTDTGVGIPKHMLENIFKVKETFTKMDRSDEVSTGLGLILCQEFLKKNGGAIWVESEERKGSSFKFTLKRKPKS